MAKATGGTLKATYVEEDVTLTLSIYEAAALKTIMNSIGGPMDKSLRRYADNIGLALHRIGFRSYPEQVDQKAYSGGMCFLETNLKRFEKAVRANRTPKD